MKKVVRKAAQAQMAVETLRSVKLPPPPSAAARSAQLIGSHRALGGALDEQADHDGEEGDTLDEGGGDDRDAADVVGGLRLAGEPPDSSLPTACRAKVD